MSNIELNKLPDENDKNFYVNSMEWTQCPICLDKKFDSSGRWNKRNRDTHVKACIKQKRTELNNKTSKSKNVNQNTLAAFLSKLSNSLLNENSFIYFFTPKRNSRETRNCSSTQVKRCQFGY